MVADQIDDPKRGSIRVDRGGGFFDTAYGCRPTERRALYLPTDRRENIGFRIARLPVNPVTKPLSQPPATADGSAPFFNGKDLTGWEGLLDPFWSVKDGSIIGSTASKGINFNTFLCSKKKYKDFELQFQVKLSKGGNTGVQIRSRIHNCAKVLRRRPPIRHV